MSNKITKITGILALSLVLAGCGDIIAKPSNYDDKLVDNVSHDINNAIKVIYDKYANSNESKEAILDEVLLVVAESKIGKYDMLDAQDKALVDERALEKLYKEISTGSYQYRGVFNEKQYAIESIYKQNYHLVNAGNEVKVANIDSLVFYNEGVFTANVDETNFTNADFKLIHIDYYADYLVDKFVPQVYRDLLVEQYVKDEQGATIGRNYARKIKYVAIEESKNYPEAARNLINTFIDNNILAGGDKADLEILANAWRGVPADLGADETDLLTAAGLIGSGKDQTLYGEILNRYNKIKDAEKETDKSIESEFTNNGSYPKEIGLQIKTNELRKKDLIVNEWAIKNGGLSSLPESIRSRVFNIGVANGVDFVKDDLGLVADAGKVDEEISPTRNTFVRNIHGDFYLVPQSYEKGDNRNFLFYENSTYYIVQIEEAVNTAKLTEGNNRYYGEIGRTDAEIEDIINNVARKLGEVSSTSTTARQFYIEKLDITFHDQDVKDFFVSTFPDIFDEE